MEWFANNIWSLWLIALFVFLVIEMLTLDFVFLMLGGASVIALISSLFGAPFWLQVSIFAVAGLLMIFLVRPVALRHLRRGPKDQLSNIDRLIGSTATILSDTDTHAGLVKIGGDTWTARSLGARLEAGSHVTVIRIDGATAVVDAITATHPTHPGPANPAAGLQ